ncbi:carbohydrate-binding module family 1 protein [Sphaerobolus stellatus SS14]|uniref:Carbohydrate-binding module family 1 protein n=1 Tax=Sphaerobolus stellatus (strain SS14) TaxID=990650 RepID=A0A0C9VV06_SPHS4|nr:carbohydrate-binding module family 1 protein [Sphaerobolus stellatus SS14]
MQLLPEVRLLGDSLGSEPLHSSVAHGLSRSIFTRPLDWLFSFSPHPNRWSQGRQPIHQLNSADFHIGVLRLPNGGTSAAAEDFFWSGIYVEQAPITTSVAGPNPGAGGSGSAPPPVSSSTTAVGTTSVPTTTVSTSTTIVSTTTASALQATQTKYGQCDGQGYTGPTACADGSTCTVSNAYYSQCL